MKVELRNIGPINRAAIDLDGLAVLVGPNASGKTTLSTACYAILLSHRATEFAVRRRVRAALQNPRGDNDNRLAPARLGELFAVVFRENLSKELARCYTPDLAKMPRRGRAGKGSAPRILIEDTPPGDPPWKLIFRIRDNQLTLEPKFPGYALPTHAMLLEQVGSLDIAQIVRSNAARNAQAVNPLYFPAARSGYVQMQSVLSALLISALGRGDFEHVAVGKISGIAADFLQFLAGIDPHRESVIPQDVADRLETELLHGRVTLSAAGDVSQLVEFAPAGLNERWPMDAAATSIAEIAPLLLYLRHSARRQDLLFIDEPEAHLHPANQVAFADVLLELSRQIEGMVIGTHSDFFVTGISNALLRLNLEHPSARPAVSLYELAPAKTTGGYEGSHRRVDGDSGFNVDQFASVAETTLDEAENLFARSHMRSS